MASRALCVGINDYPIANADLNGCVNDAKAWAAVLTKQYDFARSDVTMLLDAKATKAAILAGLKDLLSGASAGDVLVFTNSSHGTYVADTGTDGEEPDRYDEAICPVDCKTNLIVDDELRELFAEIPDRVRLTVISDSCHSGSVTRFIPGFAPDERRARFLSPKAIRRPVISDIEGAKRGTAKAPPHPESGMKELLLSGCRADEFSYDAKIGRKYHGAMTFYALQALAGADYRMTYSGLRKKLGQLLEDARFDQHPQLEGRPSFKRRQVFT